MLSCHWHGTTLPRRAVIEPPVHHASVAMTKTGTIELAQHGELSVLVLSNEPRNNAVSESMWRDMHRLFETLAGDEALRVLILRGRGERAFSAGADISEFSEKRAAPEATRAYDELVERACRKLEALPVPTLAMIHGYCIGGGLSLAAACDLRVCDTRASFALPAARLGLGYDARGIARLMALVGPAYAREILFTGERMPAERALAMGLVHHATAPEELEGLAHRLAERIRRNAPLSVRAMKACLRELGRGAGEPDLERCREWVERCNRSEDYAEGRAAFAEKREPRFRGR